MDRRRAAGALLALAVCIASSDAAPTASNQTALDLYDGAAEGCYYNFQHYGEGDRIMTNEPCLNCTCHNRMLMCYLRVCPFTKPIGQDCTVEKRADQCCPVVTCPDVPVDLLTSTSTNSPAEYGATGVGKLDKYGCNINGKYFPEGSKVPPNPNNPCEHCYCIRNMTTCVMQECTLHVDGCTPIYNKDVCCPVRYSCDHPEDEMLLLDDMTTTVRPTPGFLLTTTTQSPVTQMSQDCVHEDKIVTDGALIKTEKACEHCYCMKGDIVCVVQECGTPMENEGKNCTSLPPREGQCCPDTYICEGDEISTELPFGITTETSIFEEITTLAPPRRVGVEGSGYRKETEESYTEVTPFEGDTEGSGYDHEIGPIIDTDEKEIPEITSATTEDVLYIASATTAKTPTLEEFEKTTEPDKGLNTVPSGIEEEVPETAVPQRTTISEAEHSTEPTIISKDKTDELEDKTTVPEVITTSTDLIDKYDESLTTTEPTVRKEEEDNEVTELSEHTESEKLSTTQTQSATQTTPQFEHATSDTKTEAPSVDENEVKTDVTTELYTTKYESPVEKETSTQTISEIPTSAENTEPAGEVSSGETVKYDGSTPSISEISTTEGTTKPEVLTEDDSVKEKEITTESLLEVPTSSSKPYADGDVDTTKEIVATTLSSIELSTSTKTVEPSDEISGEVTTKEKDSTTESLIEASTQSELAESSDSEALDKTTKDKEPVTESSVETLTSTEGAKLSDEVSSDSTIQEKEDTTESSLKTSSHSVTTNVPDEISTQQAIDVTTESSIPSSISDKDTKPSELPTTSVIEETDEILSTTEKPRIPETTSIDNKENEVDDIARIPGEGDCLVNSITYRNNSDVPSTNNCHTGCRCVSSIVKCDPIICSPPPEYMDNCQPIYDSLDSCCPTYICHSGETMPPQPDSHMAGTEKPVTSSTFECNGEQCIIKQEEESPAPSDKPAVSECGSASCGDDIQGHPHGPETDKISTDCDGHGCLPSPEVCVNGNCQEQEVQPAKPCDGDKCDIEPVIIPIKNIPLCQNENDCKPQVVPCEGNDCVQVDCGTSDCGGGTVSPAYENEQKPEACTDTNDCQKQEDDAKLPCSDESCTKKEIEGLESPLPGDCSGDKCEIPKPDVTEVDKIDEQTETPIKLPETVTETIKIEPSSEAPQPAEESPVEKYGQTPSSETYSTTMMQSSEHSTIKPDFVDETSSLDTSTTAEISGSSETTESYLTTESHEEKLTHPEPTSHTVDSASSVYPAVTESQALDETTQTEPEVEIIKSTIVSTEVVDQTSKLPEEQYPTKAPEELITVGVQTVTDMSIATGPPKTSETSTELQESSVTESREPTTVSSLDSETETVDKSKPEVSTEGLSVTTIATDKEISQSPEYETTEPQHDIRTTAGTEQKTQDVTIKIQDDEKEVVTAATLQQTEQSTTKPEISIDESSTQSQEPDIKQETQTSSYEPSDESSSTLPHEIADIITTESPQRVDSDKPELNEIADVTTSIPEKTKEPDSENDIIPTEVSKKDGTPVEKEIQSTSQSELPDILSTTPTAQEEETKEPFTNKPSPSDEDETKVSDVPATEESILDKTKIPEAPATEESISDKMKDPDEPATEESILTMKPEIDSPEKQKESEPSDTSVTTSYETGTTSEEVTHKKQDDVESKPESPVTVATVKETEITKSEPSDTSVTTSYETGTTSEEVTHKKQDDVESKPESPVTVATVKETEITKDEDTSAATTESSSLTKQDDQTELSPAAPTSSSTSQASSTESEIEIPKSPEQDQVTGVPVESTSSSEIDTTGKESVSEIPEKSTTAVDEIGSEKPLSETTKLEIAVTESTFTETTEPIPVSVSEDSYQTEEIPHVTDKTKEEEGAPTEIPTDSFTSAQTPEEPSKTSTKVTQDYVTDLDSIQPTTSEYHEEKEVSTESSVQSHTEPQNEASRTTTTDIIPSTEEQATKSQSSKEPIDYSVTVIEPSTESPKEFITKEKEITASEKLFTTEGPESLHTKSDHDSTKLYPEDETITVIPVIVTEQQKDTETTDTSELGPKIKEQDTKEPDTTTSSPVTDAESEYSQPDVTSFEISKDSTEASVTESAVSSSTNIAESHEKDEEEDSRVTTSAHLPTDGLQEEPTKAPHPSESELQTEELLEVTSLKPQQSFTETPQAITTLSVPEATEDIHDESITDILREGTTPSILEETTLLPQDKSTEKTEEMSTKIPQDIVTEAPQVAIPTKLAEDTSVESQTETDAATKQTFTEKIIEPSVTDSMVDAEETTLKSDKPVTESTQEIITKSTDDIGEDELKTTRSPIELTTKSDIPSEHDITKEQETTTTLTLEEKVTEVADETVSDIQPTITTVTPEIIDTKHDKTSETLPKITTSLPEQDVTEVSDTEASTKKAEIATELPNYEITKLEEKETSEPKYDITETTPYVVELEEHTHKAVEETSTISEDLEGITKPIESILEMSTERTSATEEPSIQDKEQTTTSLPDDSVSKLYEKDTTETTPSLLPTDDFTTQSTKTPESPVEKEDEISSVQPHDEVSSTSEKAETEIPSQTEKTPGTDSSHEITMPEQEIVPVTSKATTTKVEEDITTSSPVYKPETKPVETLPPTPIPETPKPGFNEVLPTEEIPEDDGHFPPSGGPSGYGQEPDYVEEDQAFGPGTCRYGGKVYVSAQQIPRDDPCDFCFCFRSDIICLQQSCPPPIHGCHEEPIQGFCCPRYECPVAMATSVNVTTTTTTTTTTLPPHFLPHAYKGAAHRRGCQIKGHTYKVGEVVRSSSGPCLHCTCGGDGQMKCDPKACTPEPMLRQMIAAAVSAKRRR